MDDQEWLVNAVKGAKTLSDIEFVFRSLWPGLFPKPFRNPLFDFPDVVIHACGTVIKKHPLYEAAKTGDAEAASDLIHDTFNPAAIEALKALLHGRKPILISAHEKKV
jgi:hypothetical protein